MTEEGHYKVTFTAELTIRASGPEDAMGLALLYLNEELTEEDRKATIRGMTYRDKDFRVEKIESDPEELRTFMSWIPQKVD